MLTLSIDHSPAKKRITATFRRVLVKSFSKSHLEFFLLLGRTIRRLAQGLTQRLGLAEVEAVVATLKGSA